jgi:hypothetical protein
MLAGGMIFALLAFVTVLFHLAFILFVVFGGFLVARRPRLAPVHLACAAWGAYVALANRICPLTPLENWFRQQGGRMRYSGDFLEHYILAIVYPRGLTATTQQALGIAVIVLNVAVYAWILRTRRRRRRRRRRKAPGNVTPPEA